MVLETTSRTPTGTVAITDALAMGDGNRGHDLGKGAPHLLLRRRPALKEKSICLWNTPRGPSTGWSIPCSMWSTVDWPPSGAPT